MARAPPTSYPQGVEFQLQIVNISGTGVDASPTGSANISLRVDGVEPYVTSRSPASDIWVDANQFQLLEVNITENVNEDSNLTAHIWIEHDDDINSDGQAQVGEYVDHPLATSDRVRYWVLFDDRANTAGERVSIHVSGTDYVGNALLGGGDAGLSADLVTYTTWAESPLSITDVWTPASTVYPGQPFTIQVNFTDLNGPTDLTECRVGLDGAAGSTTAVVYTGANDTIWATHPGIDVRAASQLLFADDFDIDYELYLSLELDWTLESIDAVNDIRVEGFESVSVAFSQTFSQAWSFENDLEVVDLAVDDITGPVIGVLPSGATVAGGDSVRFTGKVIFSGSADVIPDCSTCRVDVGGIRSNPILSDGSFETDITVPTNSDLQGRVYSPEVVVIPSSGSDDTEIDFVLRIDGEGPVLSSVNLTELELSELEDIPLLVSGIENSGVSGDITGRWRAKRGAAQVGSNSFVVSSVMTGPGVVEWSGTMDLSTAGLRTGDFVELWFEGQDDAGNELSPLSNSPQAPLATVPVVNSLPDLSVRTATLSPPSPADGDDVSVVVTIENLGVNAASNFVVSLTVDQDTPSVQPVSSVAGNGGVTEITFTWKAKEGSRSLTITLDPDGQIDEVDENNNLHTLTVQVSEAETNIPGVGAMSDQLLLMLGVGVLMLVILVLAVKGSRKKAKYQDYVDEMYGYEEYSTGYGATSAYGAEYDEYTATMAEYGYTDMGADGTYNEAGGDEGGY
jgi:hypothetical protein